MFLQGDRGETEVLAKKLKLNQESRGNALGAVVPPQKLYFWSFDELFVQPAVIINANQMDTILDKDGLFIAHGATTQEKENV